MIWVVVKREKTKTLCYVREERWGEECNKEENMEYECVGASFVCMCEKKKERKREREREKVRE